MEKTKVIYANNDPNRADANWLAIQTETVPPYVWGIWSGKTINDIPEVILGNTDMLVIRKEQALKLFDFEKGRLEDIK